MAIAIERLWCTAFPIDETAFVVKIMSALVCRHKLEGEMPRQTILHAQACPAYPAEQVLWGAAQG